MRSDRLSERTANTVSDLLPEILPTRNGVVVAHETRSPLTLASSMSVLYGPEARVMVDASPDRVREFATGRVLARAAMSHLGYPGRPLLPGPDRAPLWPDGLVGSITHCQGLYAAAVARASAVASLGIDAEPHAPLPPATVAYVVLPGEGDRHRQLPTKFAWDRILFSAKESVFKAAHPVDGQWRDFTDVEVSLKLDGTFSASSLRGLSLPDLQGRWLVKDGLIATSAWIRVSPVATAGPAPVRRGGPDAPGDDDNASRP